MHTTWAFFTLSHILPLHNSHLNTGYLIAKLQANLVQNKANTWLNKFNLTVKNSEVCDLLTTGSRVDNPWKVTWKTHAGSWIVKCQEEFCKSFRDYTNSRVTHKTLCLDVFKVHSSLLYPHFISPYYPQNYNEKNYIYFKFNHSLTPPKKMFRSTFSLERNPLNSSYIFSIECEFWKSNHWNSCSYDILYACKILRR